MRRYRAINAWETNRVRDVLRELAPIVGVRFEHFDGYPSERRSRVIWELPYESSFGPQTIDVEVGMRPVLRPPRRAPLSQLLTDPLAGDHTGAYCWALDADEARAEKVRAAFTRDAIRDFYDLDQLLAAGNDFTLTPSESSSTRSSPSSALPHSQINSPRLG